MFLDPPKSHFKPVIDSKSKVVAFGSERRSWTFNGPVDPRSSPFLSHCSAGGRAVLLFSESAEPSVRAVVGASVVENRRIAATASGRYGLDITALSHRDVTLPQNCLNHAIVNTETVEVRRQATATSSQACT